jgi:hypothetical protein
MGSVGSFIFSGGLSALFPSPKKPKKPGTPPPAPSQDEEALAAAEAEAKEQREAAKKRSSRQRTILTSPKGVVDEEAPLGPKTLLGAPAKVKK